MQKTIYNQQKPFVYLWRDRLSNRYYLGFHGGTNPRYVCSSKHMMIGYKARPEDFTRRILQVGHRREMIELERKLLITRKGQFGKRYYNLTVSRKNGFPEWTDEMRRKASKSHSGRRKTKETRIRMSQPRSEEHKRNMSRSHLGLYHTEETISRMSQPKSEEHKRNLKKAQSSRWTEASRKKMSVSMTGIKRGPWTEERKKKASEFYKEWWRQRKLTAYPL